MKLTIRIILMATSALLMAACTSPLYHQSGDKVMQTAQQIKQIQNQASTSAPAVLMKQGFYVNTTPVAVNNQPQWMRRSISLQANQMPLSMLVARLLQNSNMSTSYDNTVQPGKLVSINYKGTVGGALKVLGDKTNYQYTSADNTLTWSSFETKVFNISFMPGQSTYLVGETGSGGGASSSGSSEGANHLNDDQYSNLQASLSVWNDLRRTLKQLKSKKGTVVVSESTTSVTVRDYPSNVRAMSRYISQMNIELSKEVSIKVQLLEINLSKKFHYGINWNVFTKDLKLNLGLAGNISALTDIGGGNLVINRGLRIGDAGGSEALIDSLNQQGKVRVVTRPQVVTMNNQMASIRITQSQGYVKSVQQTSTNNNTTSSITPGSITDGFTLYVLPKIQGNKVFLQISSTISNLDKLQKVSNEPTQTSTTSIVSTGTQPSYTAIQVPTVSEKQFNQRSVVYSGATLVIAGFKQLKDGNQQASMFGIKPLGGEGATSSNVETLLLITPTILADKK